MPDVLPTYDITSALRFCHTCSTPKTSANGSSSPASLNQNVAVNDIVVMHCHANNTMTLAGVTTNYSNVASDGGEQDSGGSYQATSAETPRTLTATTGGTFGATTAVWG